LLGCVVPPPLPSEAELEAQKAEEAEIKEAEAAERAAED